MGTCITTAQKPNARHCKGVTVPTLDWATLHKHKSLTPKMRHPHGKSTKELSKIWGLSLSATKQRINKLLSAGLIRKEIDIRQDGKWAWQPIPVYLMEDKK